MMRGIGKSKLLYCGEWVKVRNMMNKHFPAGGACELWRRMSCAPVWWSIGTRRVRCMKCFDAEGEHWRQVEAEQDEFIRARAWRRGT
jgi:hypothetical protein